MARAVARPPDGRTSRSALPWMTSVGALIRRRSLTRLPADWIAASWRPEPAALAPRSKDVSASRRSSSSRRSNPGEPMIPKTFTRRSMYSSLVRGGLARKDGYRRSAGWPEKRLPVLDMIETRERTRSGHHAAISWASMPPIDAPTTWGVDAQLVEQPDAVVGHVS